MSRGLGDVYKRQALCFYFFFFFIFLFFFKQKTAYEISACLVGSEMCIRDSFYPFNTNGNRGVACGLQNIQKWCDGEPLNGRVRAEDEFDALDDADDEDFLD